jgi:hypothetical protein
MVNVRPLAPSSYLYPCDRRTLDDTAYYFDFDYEGGRSPDAHAREAIDLANAWMADGARGMLELRQEPDGSLQILDIRRELAAARRRAAARVEGGRLSCVRPGPDAARAARAARATT